MNPRNKIFIDFEQGDRLLVEDKLEEVFENCTVMTQDDENMWTFKTDLDKIIVYDAYKASNYKVYRYEIIKLL